MSTQKPLRIAIVIGEASGDILGAGLVKALKKRYPDCEFEGIGGPLMLAEDFNSLYPMERLSVMGITSVLKRYPELYMARRRLINRWLSEKNRPDVFIGIDAPDFNIGIELRLKSKGIPVCHYVSPSVWAWRPKRIIKIKKAVDLMLCLFPFEAKYYEEHNIPVAYVGHPLANQIPLEVDKDAAKSALGLTDKNILAVLPGSRTGEAKLLCPVFFAALERFHRKMPNYHLVIAAYNEKIRRIVEQSREDFPKLPVTVVEGDSQNVMIASDAILMASGTATLEGMLIKRPMIVAYKLSALTYRLVKNLFSIKKFALPNLLTEQAWIPEYIQDDAEPEALAQAIEEQITREDKAAMLASFLAVHQTLRQNASENAAEALDKLLLQHSK